MAAKNIIIFDFTKPGIILPFSFFKFSSILLSGLTGASLQDYTEGEKLFSDPRHLQGISGINIVQV
jgi:hypothetical protein